MATEHDDLPAAVNAEIETFVDVNVTWLNRLLFEGSLVEPEACESGAQTIYAAIAGAQLVACGSSDVVAYDALIESYRSQGSCPPRADA